MAVLQWYPLYVLRNLKRIFLELTELLLCVKMFYISMLNIEEGSSSIKEIKRVWYWTGKDLLKF